MVSQLRYADGRMMHGATDNPIFDSNGALFHQLTYGAGFADFPLRAAPFGQLFPQAYASDVALFTCDPLCTHLRGAFKIEGLTTGGGTVNTLPTGTWFNVGGTFVRVYEAGNINTSGSLGGTISNTVTKYTSVLMQSFTFVIVNAVARLKESSHLVSFAGPSNYAFDSVRIHYRIRAGLLT